MAYLGWHHMEWLLGAMRHPAVQAVQLQATLILLIGVAGWTWAGLRRRREAARLRAAGYAGALKALRQHQQQQEQQKQQQQQKDQHQQAALFKSRQAPPFSQDWPPLAVVCPVKGCRQASAGNWTSQLAAAYCGPRLFVFVVEAADDPAAAALRQLMQQAGHDELPTAAQQGKQSPAPASLQPWAPLLHDACVLGAWQQCPGQLVVLVEAGQASSCSQKIHNILAGIDLALPALQQPAQQATARQSSSAGKSAAAQAEARPAVSVLAMAGGSAASSPAASSCGGAAAAAAAARGSAAAAADAGAPASGGAGAAAGARGYVCVLDDDVALHPMSLMQLVDDLEADPSCYMVTGYPFDIIAPAVPSSSSSSGSSSSSASSSSLWGRLLAHAAAAYHLPLLIGFSIADRGSFVWGGVMVLRSSALAGQQQQQQQQQGETRSILEVWRDGGYSDDLLLAGYCAAQRLPIGLPRSALFPQLLAPTYTLAQYWNYLRRQLYVLDTYFGRHDKALNHAMMVLHSAGSAAFTAAAAALAVQLTAAAALAAAAAACGAAQVLAALAAAAPDAGGGGAAALAGGVLRQLCGVRGSGCAWLHAAAGQCAAAQPQLLRLLAGCGSRATWAFVGAGVLSQCAVAFMTRQCLGLFRLLSPGAPAELLAPRVSWVLLWCGWVLEHAVLPTCMAYTWLCDAVDWGGICYHRRGGKVVRVVHPPPPR